MVLLVFAILNIDDVRVDFAVDTVATPLVVVIALCALLGFVGWFVGAVERRVAARWPVRVRPREARAR